MMWTTVYESSRDTYGRYTDITRGQDECEICKDKTTVLSIDTSDGEYNTFCCCKTCFEQLWVKDGE